MKSNSEIINVNELSIPNGTRDIIGLDMRFREYIVSKIKSIYENFGFIPQKTSVIENASIFKGHHGEGEKIIFHLDDKNNNKLALRYDLTVPLARIVNMYPELPKPYKRYQIADSFRDDDVDKGHFREFVQCDADIIGTSNPASDAEVILMAYKVIKELGIEDFTLIVNHRMILKGVAYEAGIKDYEKIIDMQCAMDNTRQTNNEFVGDLRKNLLMKNFNLDSIDKIIEIMDTSIKIIRENNVLTAIEKLKKAFKNNKLISEAILELDNILKYLPEEVLDKIELRFSLARGANYYTGVIFEGVADNIKVGSILGGGRYDNLVEEVGEKSEPAVGMAIGLERVLIAIKELNSIDINESIPNKVLAATNVDENTDKVFTFVNELRNYVNVDLHFDTVENVSEIKKNLKLNKYKGMLFLRKNNEIQLIDFKKDISFRKYIISAIKEIDNEINIIDK